MFLNVVYQAIWEGKKNGLMIWIVLSPTIIVFFSISFWSDPFSSAFGMLNFLLSALDAKHVHSSQSISRNGIELYSLRLWQTSNIALVLHQIYFILKPITQSIRFIYWNFQYKTRNFQCCQLVSVSCFFLIQFSAAAIYLMRAVGLREK